MVKWSGLQINFGAIVQLTGSQKVLKNPLVDHILLFNLFHLNLQEKEISTEWSVGGWLGPNIESLEFSLCGALLTDT